jgi:hypothetical protein
MITAIDQAKAVKTFIIGTFVTLYLLVSIISTIHVIDFFRMSNPNWLAISLAIAFEIGAAASLASIIALQKMNKTIVWLLFIVLTLMQAMGNTYYAYTHLQDFQGWVELFGLNEEDLIFQKRILSLVSGAILPIVALGFIKALVDYIKPTDDTEPVAVDSQVETVLKESNTIKEEASIIDQPEPIQAKVTPVAQAEESQFDIFKMEPVALDKPKRIVKKVLTEELKNDPQIDKLKQDANGGPRPNPDQILAVNGKF